MVRAARSNGVVGIPEEQGRWGGSGGQGGRFAAEEGAAAPPSSSSSNHHFYSFADRKKAPRLPPRNTSTASISSPIPYVAPSLAAPPLPPRLQRTSSLARSPHQASHPTSYPTSPSSSALSTRLLSTSTSSLNLNARLVASAGLRVGKEWGKKGAGKLTETWKASRTTTPSLAPTPPSLPDGVRLPATILGVRVPRRTGEAFGIELEMAVERTRVKEDGLYRKKDSDEVVGDDARKWLPAVALRCLQYLEEWGRKEEGLYRIPGSTTQIAQLRALFDAGMDLELTEIHQADLDPHAVASVFKAWLREIPESLLSSNLEGAIDILLTESIGYSASATHFLGTRNANAGTGLVDGRAPRELLEKLRELFGGGMPAEQYYLLRSLSYHLARLAASQGVNLMSLSNILLILSPTLKLSPIMLRLLVEEREILFSKPNDSARLREASIALNAFVSSPPLSSSAPNRSPTLPPSSRNPSPHPPPLPSLPSSPTLPDSTSTRTPIADLFVVTPPSSSKPSPTNPTFPSTYIPSRSPAASSFFSNRDPISRSLTTSRKPTEVVTKKLSTSASSPDLTRRKPVPLVLPRELDSLAEWSDDEDPRAPSFESCSTVESGVALAPTLEMPKGLMGVGMGEEEAGSGLLSVEERRRFFGG